jgi:uroporphyrinogen-III synthase
VKLIVTRPEPDAGRTAAALEAHGHEAVRAPLMNIEFIEDGDIAALGYQAILVTSANGIRALVRQAGHDRYFGVPVHAVGETSAAEARGLGFWTVHAAAGDLASLAGQAATALRPEDGPLLYVTGDKIAGDLAGMLGAKGFDVRRHVLYRAVAADALPRGVPAGIESGGIDGVVLMSPRTAEIWRRLAPSGLFDGRTRPFWCFCLSPAVAAALTADSRSKRENIVIAKMPALEDLISVIAESGSKDL